MKYCNQCKLSVISEEENCPLCQNKLIEKEGSDNVLQDAFPRIPTFYSQYQVYIQVMLFLSIVAAVVSVTVNYIYRSKGWWSLFVVGALIAIWISLAIAINKRRNISKNILWQMVWITILCTGADFLTGWRGWSIDFVMPLLYMSVMLALVIINRMMKLSLDDYLVYTLLGAIFGIIPIIFLITDVLHNYIPSLFCVASSIIFMAAILIFRGEQMMGELRRRFHW